MIIKMQTQLFPVVEDPQFLLYNRDRSFEAIIDSEHVAYADFKKLYNEVDEGIGKIYFKARITKEGQILIKEFLSYPADKRTNF